MPFSLLRTHAPFRRLFLAMTASAVGTYVAALALSVDIFDRTGSGRWLAILLVADFLPIIVVGLALGPLIDRLQRRALMVVADVVRLGVFAALPFVDQPELIVVLAGVNGMATGFFRPAVWAGVPNLVDEEELDAATSLLSTVENAAWMVGPVVSGVLLSVWSPSAAYWVNAASFGLSALLLAGLSARDLQSAEPLSRGHWRDVRDGIAVVRGSTALLTVLIVWNTAAIGNACINVAEVVFAKTALDAGNVGLGVIVGATGLGLVIGSFLAPALLGSLGMGRVYGGSLVVMALGFGAAAASPTIYVAVPLIAFATVGNGCVIVCNQLLVQRGAADAYRGRALAVLMSSYYAILPVGMALAGWLTDSVGARATWATGALIFVVASLVAFARTYRMRSDVLSRTPEAQAADVPAVNGAAAEGLVGVERMRALLQEVEHTRQAEAERQAPRRRVLKYAGRTARRRPPIV